MISESMRLATGMLAFYLLSATSSFAVPFLAPVTFNDLQVGEQALNFYDAGFGSLGTGPGPGFGISFTPDFVTASGGVIFPNTNILQSELLTGASGMMNISGGYSGIFSFYYTANQRASAQLFSGLNGTGSVVSTISLNAASIWTPAGGNASLFQSIVFTGSGVAVDNITFGALVIPEPVTTSLLFIGSAFFLVLAGPKAIQKKCSARLVKGA